jgi:hypothetical protein
VGPCCGDFATSYNRINGRLYVAKNAILFYSNLFGFERRLHLLASDIIDISLSGSTSIRIVMVDCEEYIFKKISSRQSVLGLLRDVCREAGGLQKTNNVRLSNETNLSSHTNTTDAGDDLNDSRYMLPQKTNNVRLSSETNLSSHTNTTDAGDDLNDSRYMLPQGDDDRMSNRPHLNSTDSTTNSILASSDDFVMTQRGNRKRAQSAPLLTKEERQYDYAQSPSSHSFIRSSSGGMPQHDTSFDTIGSSEEILSLGINIIDTEDDEDWKKQSKPLSEIALKVRQCR